MFYYYLYFCIVLPLLESPAKSPFLQAPFKVQRSKFNVFNRLDDNNFVKNDNLDFLQLNLTWQGTKYCALTVLHGDGREPE